MKLLQDGSMQLLVVDAGGSPVAAQVHGAVRACSLQDAYDALGAAAPHAADVPALAAALRAAGEAAVCIRGADERGALDWLDTPHASGWLAPARAGAPAARDAAGFASEAAAALAAGFVATDAAVLARLAELGELPLLSWDAQPPALLPAVAPARAPIGLYALVDSAARLRELLDAGVRTVQLRIKTPATPDAAWHAHLREQLQEGLAACSAAGAELVVNDHWRLARELGAPAVHLGQEDLLAMQAEERTALRASGIALGISSHSLWELCRARALAPRYIACGPVWPTITKDMPWLPQGLDNLAWWSRMAGPPVVAIGGVLGAEHVEAAARVGADGACMVRGLGSMAGRIAPALRAAFEAGRAGHLRQPPAPTRWPHPTLPAVSAG
jgi:hydroxymethylpyrimidine kinase/phosphomethylpyrimidine kinase/thiamine-phosphate diphosphorylase